MVHNKLKRDKINKCEELHLGRQKQILVYSKTQNKQIGVIFTEEAWWLLTHLFADYCNVKSLLKGKYDRILICNHSR